MNANPWQPLVTCIMPTRNRRQFAARAIEYFHRQDYPRLELVIVDDGDDPIQDLAGADARIRYIHLNAPLTLGAKRNLACQHAAGEIIVQWDDDDWQASWRIGYQVKELLMRHADVCGINQVLFYDTVQRQGWKYAYTWEWKDLWLAGSSLCYHKSFWQTNPFLNINVGEDSHFLWTRQRKRLAALTDPEFLVAINHPGNTSPRHYGAGWTQFSTAEIRKLMGSDWDFYDRAVFSSEPGDRNRSHRENRTIAAPRLPLVTCAMATKDRRPFVSQAIRYFLQQDYPNRELVILDDGDDSVKDLIPNDSRILYQRLGKKFRLGVKRNLLCSMASGEIVVFWDDDDWYCPERISIQVEPILSGKADMTAFGQGLMLDLADSRFWRSTPELHAQMWFSGVYGGTVAFVKSIWDRGTRFLDEWLAEDAAFIRAAMTKGARLARLPNNGAFVYVRHGSNTWTFQPGKYADENGWELVDRPGFMPRSDLEFYGMMKI